MVKRIITPRFYRGIPGSNPGRGTVSPREKSLGFRRDLSDGIAANVFFLQPSA